ncbi:MAG: Spy/CpxP family protein refolding chaperone [Thermodesulfobacteriota bacterium]
MKKRAWKNALAAAVFFTAIGVCVQSVEAVEEHHKADSAETAVQDSETPAQATAPGSGQEGGSGMMGKMAGMEKKGGGMMDMMMAHMMGGPGGMGTMTGALGAEDEGLKGGRAAHMIHMLEELNLSPGQWDRVRSLAREKLDRMADLWAQRMKMRIELAALNYDQEIDPQHVKNVFVKAAEARAGMFLTSLEYMKGLREILTPEQLEKLEGPENKTAHH